MELEEVIVKEEPLDTGEIIEEVENVELSNDIVEPVAITINKVPSYALVYVCSICMKVFGYKNLFEHHLKIVHRPLTVNILSGAYCDICKKILDENVYDSHLPQCITNFNSLPVVVSNLYQRRTRKFECTICYKNLINLNKLSEHVRTVHRPITTNYTGKSNYSFCDTCKNLFKDDIFTHFPCNAVDVKCFFCLTKMPLKHHFAIHSLYSQGFRQFQCIVCTIDTRLMNFTELNEHMKEHNQLGVFQCVKCNVHMEQTDLEEHYQRCHNGCKCVTDLCSCEEYNEYFYIRNILKVDIPFENQNSTTDTQNKSIKTYTTRNIAKIKSSCKSSSFSNPLESIESTSFTKSENKSKPKVISAKIKYKPKNIRSTASSSKSVSSETSCTELKNKSRNVFDGKSILTTGELLQKDRIDRESFRRNNFATSVFKNSRMNKKLKTPKLSKFQLKKLRGLILKQNNKRYQDKLSAVKGHITEDSKTSNIDEQNSAVTKKQDTLTSEVICSEIVKEEQTELLNTDNIKNEIENLLEDILSDSKQNSQNVQENSMSLNNTDESENEEDSNGNHKKIKIQRNTENSACQSINNSENSDSVELDDEQLEDSENVSQEQENENSDADEEMYQVYLVNTDNETDKASLKTHPTFENETEASLSDQKSNESDIKQSQDTLNPIKNYLFQDLDDVENEQFSEDEQLTENVQPPNNVDPDYSPNFETPADVEQNDDETCRVCKVCGLDFANLHLLINHLMQEHRLRAAYVKRYVSKSIYCALCRIYTTQNHFPCSKNAVMDTCHFCNMSLPKREHFELHNIDFVTYNKMFCTLCSDRIEYKIKSLNEHRIKAHKEIGAFQCVICKDKFSSSGKLKEHLVYSKHKFNVKNSARDYKLLKNHRDVLKYYKCKHCTRIFFAQRHLMNHRCHKYDLCFVCGQTFKNPSYLKEHLNKHLKTESYNCRTCSKSFMTRKHMIQHQKIHETNKEFKCLECTQTFTQQTSLIYHMATHTKENVFKCSVCDILFDKQSKLTAHMQIHNDNGTNPHKCDICKKFFSHKCKLLVHKRTHRETNDDK